MVGMRALALCLSLIVMLSPSAGMMTPLLPVSQQTVSPESKIDSRLLNATSGERDVLVGYDERAGELKARSAIAALDEMAEVVQSYSELSMLRVRMAASAIRKLAAESFITGVWSNEIAQMTSPKRTSTTTVFADDYVRLADLIGAKELWDEGYNGTGVVIAVLDTGVDMTHPDLDDMDDDANTTDSKVTAFASFVEADTLPTDIIGHGTYAASIAAGTGNMSSGLYAGIAPGATILSAKVTLGGLFAAPSWMVSGIEWACSHGADIILMPFNTFGSPGDAVSKAVEYATLKGVLVVAASGDDGPDYLTVMSPGGSEAALTVGAYDLTKSEVPAFSGRGPSLEMITKPDIVAPGVGIVGAKALAGLASAGFGDFDLGDLGEIAGLLGGGLGEDVDDGYVIADTTTASASIVAGAAAILMQAFDRATPIVIANALRDTAVRLPYGANDAGAGLMDLQAAFSYLSLRQTPVEPRSRTTGLPLLALGLITSAGRASNTTLLMSSFGTTIVALDQRLGQDSGTHLLMGMFYLRWNNMEPTSLMMFQVKRELHQVHLPTGLDNYNRYVGILSYDEVYVAILVESYNANNPLQVPPSTGLRITPFILNLSSENIDNVTLFLSYSLDIYADGADDHGKYALNNQQLFAYGISEDLGDFYMGVNSSRSLSAFEVGNSSTLSSHISNDNLTGSTSFDGPVGLGMKWDFGSVRPSEQVNVTLALAFGENRTVLDSMIETLWVLGPSSQMQQNGDLIVVEADIPRVARIGTYYQSRSVVMNIGVESQPMIAALIVGKTENTTGTVFADFFTMDNVSPFHAVVLNTEWSPERETVYTAAWVVSGGIDQAIWLFQTSAAQLAASSLRFLDDFLLRDLFVITPIASVSVFPSRLPFGPFDVRFPADFGLYTMTIFSTVSLGNLTVEKYGNASDWGNVTLTPAETVEGYYNVSLFLFAPTMTMDGYHRCDYVFSTAHGWTANVTLEVNLRYPRAMILLDTSHGGGLSGIGGFGGAETGMNMGGGTGFPLAQEDSGGLDGISMGDLSLSDLGSLTDLLESLRLTTFSGLSNLRRIMGDRGLDLIETPGVELSKDLLSQFAGLVIISPTKEFNSTEIATIRDFSGGGGKLVILGDYEGRANLTALNPLLQAYGYEMRGEHRNDNTTEMIQGSPLTRGMSSLWLGGGTYIYNNQSMAAATLTGRPVALLDSSRPELVLFGSSRILMNKNLVKCNNTVLLQNLNEFFLTSTLTGRTALAENTTRYPVGRSVYINLNVEDYTGRPVNDLFVAVAFELPNGSLAFFIAGFVQDGLYSSQFVPSYYNGPGRVNAIFLILKTTDYAMTYASISFFLYLPPTTNGTVGPSRLLEMAQVAAISSTGVFGFVALALFRNRRRKRKQLHIPEVDTLLVHEIDTSLNTLLAAFVQMGDVIRSEGLERIEKVEALRSMRKTLEDAERQFDKVDKKVGGV
ncbi:MAG: S8 family serine peptidase [Candidatus Thorarchaeota archaeon]|nr:S8 family serine peptidase [Candidatus Thorarchaeota archaeon]